MTESIQVLEWMAQGKLQASRILLRDLLEDRFGVLPEALTQRLEAITDPEQLREAARRVSHLVQLDELRL